MDHPINLVGFFEARAAASDELQQEHTGDVITRHGEYIGTWSLIEDWRDDSQLGFGEFRFVPDGEDKPAIVRPIGTLDSPSQFGYALVTFCSEIRSHFEATNGPIDG